MSQSQPELPGLYYDAQRNRYFSIASSGTLASSNSSLPNPPKKPRIDKAKPTFYSKELKGVHEIYKSQKESNRSLYQELVRTSFSHHLFARDCLFGRRNVNPVITKPIWVSDIGSIPKVDDSNDDDMNAPKCFRIHTSQKAESFTILNWQDYPVSESEEGIRVENEMGWEKLWKLHRSDTILTGTSGGLLLTHMYTPGQKTKWSEYQALDFGDMQPGSVKALESYVSTDGRLFVLAGTYGIDGSACCASILTSSQSKYIRNTQLRTSTDPVTSLSQSIGEIPGVAPLRRIWCSKMACFDNQKSLKNNYQTQLDVLIGGEKTLQYHKVILRSTQLRAERSQEFSPCVMENKLYSINTHSTVLSADFINSNTAIYGMRNGTAKIFDLKQASSAQSPGSKEMHHKKDRSPHIQISAAITNVRSVGLGSPYVIVSGLGNILNMYDLRYLETSTMKEGEDSSQRGSKGNRRNRESSKHKGLNHERAPKPVTIPLKCLYGYYNDHHLSHGLAIHEKYPFVAAGCDNGIVKIWNYETGLELKELDMNQVYNPGDEDNDESRTLEIFCTRLEWGKNGLYGLDNNGVVVWESENLGRIL